MAVSNRATECIQDLINKINTLPLVKNKTLWVYDEEQLMDKTKGLTFPAVGVVYEGIRSTDDFPGRSGKVGFTSELVASLMLLTRQDAPTGKSSHLPAVQLLDDIRQCILGTRSPTGHLWKFIVEAAASEKHGTVVWVQTFARVFARVFAWF